MNTVPIIAGSQVELDAFLRANPWLNPAFVTRVTEPEHLQWRGGLVLALPGWEVAPAIAHPRKLLEVIAQRGMHLVVLDPAEFHLESGLDTRRDSLEAPAGVGGER